MIRRLTQLVLASLVVAGGVALILGARLGSDGFSTLLSGVSRITGWPFWVGNVVIAAVLVGIAWALGLRPGIGTILQPLVTSVTINLLLAVMPVGLALGWRITMLIGGLLLLALGVAGYLAANAGVGAAEAISVALEPRIPFRWSYLVFQTLCFLTGWWCGADVGVGTIVVAALIGPLVTRMGPVVAWVTRSAPSASAR